MFVAEFNIIIYRREEMKVRKGRILKWKLVQVLSAISFHLCVIYTAHFRITDTCWDKEFESEKSHS